MHSYGPRSITQDPHVVQMGGHSSTHSDLHPARTPKSASSALFFPSSAHSSNLHGFGVWGFLGFKDLGLFGFRVFRLSHWHKRARVFRVSGFLGFRVFSV